MLNRMMNQDAGRLTLTAPQVPLITLNPDS